MRLAALERRSVAPLVAQGARRLLRSLAALLSPGGSKRSENTHARACLDGFFFPMSFSWDSVSSCFSYLRLLTVSFG